MTCTQPTDEARLVPRPHDPSGARSVQARLNRYRARQYGDAGQNIVIMEIWNDDTDTWEQLRGWTSMHCWNSNGSNNCTLEFLHEANAADSAHWFNINGGNDGLRMREARLRTAPNVWPLFSSAQFAGHWTTGSSPYSRCPVYDWYSFRSLPPPTGPVLID